MTVEASMTDAFLKRMRTMRKHRLMPEAAFPISEAEKAELRGSPASGNLSRSGSSYGAPSPGRPTCFESHRRILDTRRRPSPDGEAHCSYGFGGRGNATNSRACRTANCTTSALPRPTAGRKSTSHGGAIRLKEPVASARTRFKAASRTSDRHKGCRRSGRSPDSLPSGRARGLPSAPGWCRAAGS